MIKNKKLINKKDLEHNTVIYNLDIAYLENLLKEAGKKYLNIFRVETENELVDMNSVYVLSYVKQKISKEYELYDTIINVLEEYVSLLNNNSKKYIEKYKEMLGYNDYLLYKFIKIVKNNDIQEWNDMNDLNKDIIYELLSKKLDLDKEKVQGFISDFLNNKISKDFYNKVEKLMLELKHENIFLEQEKKIFELKDKNKWKIMSNEEKDRIKEVKEKIGKIKEENMTEDNVESYTKGESVILDVVSENWEKYRAGTLFVKEIIKRYGSDSKKFYFNVLDNILLLNNKKIKQSEFLENISKKLKKKTFKKYTFEIENFNDLERVEKTYKFSDKYNLLNRNIGEYLELAKNNKIKEKQQIKDIIKHIELFKKYVFEYEDFYICQKGLNKILQDKNYITYIFYIDKIHLTFDIHKLKGFLMSLGSIESINKMFLNFDLKDINKALKDRFKVGQIETTEEAWYKFLNTIKELNKNKCDYNLSAYAEVIARKIFGLHFQPYRLFINKDGQELYNRKEVLKSSKTEDKLNSTFTSEIFHIALDEQINCEIDNCIV